MEEIRKEKHTIFLNLKTYEEQVDQDDLSQRNKSNNKDREAYKKQQNLCVSLLRQNKKEYLETLDMKSVTDNKMFWKTVAPLFSNKSKASNKITLSENEKLISNDQKSAEVFNNYFNSIVEELNIPIDQNLLNDASLFDDLIIAAIHKYKRHPSILKIKEQ